MVQNLLQDNIAEQVVLGSGLATNSLAKAFISKTVSKQCISSIVIANQQLSPQTFYQSLAAQLGIEFATTIGCNAENLSSLFTLEEFITYDFLCFEEKEGLVVIISNINEQLKKLLSRCGNQYTLVLTYQNIVNQFIIDNFLDNIDSVLQQVKANPKLSAASLVELNYHKLFIICLLIVAFIGKFINIIWVLNIFALIYFAENILKISAFLVGIYSNFIYHLKPKIHSYDTPKYTILIPLYREQNMVQQIVASLNNFNYPREQLDVIFLLELDDLETIAACKQYLPAHFRMFIVPDYLPKTKPKALNYGLLFAKGEFITIYDAEDKPEPEQLNKAVASFRRYSQKVICLQARLNYYNYNYNLLTKFFAIEYSIWFDLLIPGLANLRMPVPLGGTSNHFRTKNLRLLGGWDSYNVTEDADLGIRLKRLGYKTKIIYSLTQEEATSNIKSWLYQRSRWSKGFYQTFLVHFRQPIKLLWQLGPKNFLSFFLFIGVQPILFLLNPIMLICALVNPYEAEPGLYQYFFTINLIMMILLPIVKAIVVCLKNRWFKLLPYTLIYSLYFVLHSIAAFIAIKQLITSPFFWNKTSHGKDNKVS